MRWNCYIVSSLLSLNIGLDEITQQPVVTKEVLSYRRGQYGRPFRFLDFSKGKGASIINEEEFEAKKQDFQEKREEQTLDAPDILAIKGLGQFQRFKAISSFRRLLENWYVSNFQIQAAQSLEDTGISEHLSYSPSAFMRGRTRKLLASRSFTAVGRRVSRILRARRASVYFYAFS